MWELRFVGTQRKLKETGKTLISDGPEPQLKGFWTVYLMEVKRPGVERKDLD